MTSSNRGELLARGRTAEVYAWSSGQVLKLFFEWCPPEWIQREVDVGRWLQSTDLPTPELRDTISIDGRRGIIFDRVEGPSMLSDLSAKPWLFSTMARQLAEMHSSIHAIVAPELPPLRPHLHKSIMNAEELPSDLRDQALDTLQGLPDGNTLCHFDYHPDQIAITQEGPVVLDWMTALQGSPLADVARTSVLISFAQAPYANWFMRVATDLVRKSFHDRYRSWYFRLNPGVGLYEFQQWLIPVAAARIAEKVPGERESILEFLSVSTENVRTA